MVALGRLRKVGGGRKSQTRVARDLTGDLSKRIEATSRGDPQPRRRWPSKSSRPMANEVTPEGPSVSHRRVAQVLDEDSLPGTRKVKEGADPRDRDAPFRFIAEKTKDIQPHGPPVISVDTRSRNAVASPKTGGKNTLRTGNPLRSMCRMLGGQEKGKAAPYGGEDLSKNAGWVSLGMSSDTAEFAVNRSRQGWPAMGGASDANALPRPINAEGAGRHGSRVRCSKAELPRFATDMGLVIPGSPFPLGTSK